MALSPELTQQVRDRARLRCEYCRMHQSLQGATFHIEHVQPSTKGGLGEQQNLALACPSCNLHKADRTEAVDPISGVWVPLFHPRRQRWSDHFEWNGYDLAGRTEVGRATLVALDLNQPRRLQIRQAEETFGLFPPADD